VNVTLRAVAVASAVLVVLGATTGADPLAGIVLDDGSGRSWDLDELRGAPVLLVIADRQASRQAYAWGERLAARTEALVPWRAAGKVAWVSVADLRRVPDYARDGVRARLREWDAGRSDAERRQSSPLLLDWGGLLGERFGADRAEALLVLLSPDHRTLAQARGTATDEGVTRLIEAITNAATGAGHRMKGA
jgi:hypothetical protein